MSIKAKQVAGVTTLVVLIVVVLSGYHLATLARMSLEETQHRGQMLALAIFQTAQEVTPAPGVDLKTALRENSGVRSILQSSIGYGPSVVYAAIADANGLAVAHSFPEREGQVLDPQDELVHVVEGGPSAHLRAVNSEKTYEIRQPMLAGDEQWSIRIGVSTILLKDEFDASLKTTLGGIVAALILSTLVAAFLAQWMLRPIHVIQSGLTRLGRGELDVTLDLPGEEFRDLGSSFEAVSAQLSAVRAKPLLPAASTDLESVMENLEDAVALYSPSGEIIFTNASMKQLLADHKNHPPMKQLIDQTIAGRKDVGPIPLTSADPESPERLLMTHAIEDNGGRFVGAMLVARNLGYLTHVHSSLKYSRKLAALGRLMAGVAHEVKNPLNAMTIHLELLKQKLNRAPAMVGAISSVSGVSSIPDGQRTTNNEQRTPADVEKHVGVIADEIKRLDEVVVGFLKFARPEELKLQPIRMSDVLSDIATSVSVEAERNNVTVKVDCPNDGPEINADPGMLRQALLNLALNACQAMPNGGTLRLSCRTASRNRVEIDVEDTGVGIPPEHLSRIFDLYFTTKERGSGIGLSMVYRIVQLHDGDVEVESTPGRGTRFRLLFPSA